MFPEKSIQVQDFTRMPVFKFELGIMKCLGLLTFFTFFPGFIYIYYQALNPENLNREVREICVTFGSISLDLGHLRPYLEVFY